MENKLKDKKIWIITGCLVLLAILGTWWFSSAQVDISDIEDANEYFKEADEAVVKFQEARLRRDNKNLLNMLEPSLISQYMTYFKPEEIPEPEVANLRLTQYTLIRYPKDLNTVYYKINFQTPGGLSTDVHKLIKTSDGWKIADKFNLRLHTLEFNIETQKITPQPVRYEYQ
ncbi:hypothetical protein [Thermoflavimicrobium daqui]|jgi:hypothetical protein|uniref:Uncharacterized protein n=1 Tax=Thermoflavimicrobium daqui TaxID=2137476 RepID=A0A364K1U0_9BACL|nr:hypothetical protein [Thermoflavimicrobium daqui]RAL21925.1 hypothetical protein DL897_15145 [Thermoflavimicrobium daqui]